MGIKSLAIALTAALGFNPSKVAKERTEVSAHISDRVYVGHFAQSAPRFNQRKTRKRIRQMGGKR